jgi:glucose-6-phosphate isomerase
MWKEGLRLGIDLLSIPKQVGGRYSVLSPVGLFPLAMANINVESLLKGAEEMRNICLENSSENYALNSSVFQFLFWKQGKSIHNSFYFHPELESLGKWYRQLMGESIGKDQKGITPIVSIGSVDHHSMVQLYWGGPADKTTEIVYSQKTQDCIIPTEQLFPSLSSTKGKNTSEIVAAIQQGTSLTYDRQKQPHFEIVFDGINEHELGAYMQYKMIEILYLARLMNINAFDQPQVELYKTETRKILANK